MSRFLALALALAVASCGSSTIVDWTDVEEETFFPTDTGNHNNDTGDPDDIFGKDEEDPNDNGQVISDNVLLEFHSPYGDDHAQCQGYADPPANTQKISDCNFTMYYNTIMDIKVVFFLDGQPMQGQEIEWTLSDAKDPETDKPIVTVDTLSSGTNAEGIATLNLKADQIAGNFIVTAQAVSTMYVSNKLTFHMQIIPKYVEPLTVKVKHNGTAIFDVVTVYLFEQEDGGPLCPTLIPGELPMADKSQDLLDINSTAKFTFSKLTAQNSKIPFSAVAVAHKYNGPPLAFACDDTVLVEFGLSKTVTLVLKDVPPIYKGVYEVVNHFDMLSALPDEVEEIVDIVIDFFNSPTAGLMKLTCVLANDTLDNLCEMFFATPDDPDITKLTTVGSIVTQVVNAILYGLLADNIGKDILFTGKDVGNILRDLEIHSTIEINAEPDDTGFISKEDTFEEWESVSFQWTLGEECNPADPDCGLKSYGFAAIGQDVVIGHFDAVVPGYVLGQFFELQVNPHPLAFKYGAFLNFVIEKMVLPEIAGNGEDGGPVVDSYEKFLGSLIGGKDCLYSGNCCAVFAESVAAEAGDFVKGTLQTGCDILIPLATGYFRSFLLGLDVSSGDNFTLSTPEGDPCTLYDLNNDRIIDAWGRESPPADRCMWKVKLKLIGWELFFDAEFWAMRVQ